ncbi:hypothetical protein C8A05DRAFT_13686 [Staphylotrichum tortipilum]|uniref:F-box domain-containing protein n=1 Tax=Staphylotrichum tortipilum TaxID=2831512 RepID=A0AAN6RVE0_9PEZI|nr:hypothetical protein C8A05DRAFT_13686 [Staphylotrichum longicolle]
MKTPSAASYSRAHPAPLETLPLRIFEYICTFLPHRSLLDLSLASRFCAEAAAYQRFSRIRLDIHSISKLHHDVERWTAILRHGDRFRHVRRVVAVGFLRAGRTGHNEEYLLMPDSDYDDEPDAACGSDSDSDSSAPGRRFNPNDPVVAPWLKKAQNKAWLPFARFLAQIPGLKDLVYSLTHQLPRCVLDILHQHHPRCRLHVRIFSLRSLYQDLKDQHAIDPDELALASSPCLYSIHLTYRPYDLDRRFNFNLDAVRQMVAGYAPNLKRVRLHVPYSTPLECLPPKDTNIPWMGFPLLSPEQSLTEPTPPPLAHLETLAVSGWISGPEQLSSWRHRTDFSCLQHFDFGCRLSPDHLTTLASMAADGKFQSLRSLGLRVTAENPSLNIPAALDEPASLFLQALAPLETLRLTGHFSTLTLRALLSRHGASLRTLHLLPDRKRPAEIFTYGSPKSHIPLFYDTTAVINQLAVSCPALRTLALIVQRHGGGPAEVMSYRALARFPRLERALLFLDCRVLPAQLLGPVMTAAEEGEAEEAAESDWVREVLRNCAVDEPLARAIFGEIKAARAGVPLEWLWVEPVVPEVVLDQFETFGRWLGRSWACEMRSGGRLAAREMRGKQLEWGSQIIVSGTDLAQLEDFFVDEWNALWPRSAVRDWRYQWSSFPLVGGESDEGAGQTDF